MVILSNHLGLLRCPSVHFYTSCVLEIFYLFDSVPSETCSMFFALACCMLRFRYFLRLLLPMPPKKVDLARCVDSKYFLNDGFFICWTDFNVAARPYVTGLPWTSRSSLPEKICLFAVYSTFFATHFPFSFICRENSE